MVECPECGTHDTEYRDSEQKYGEQDQFQTVVETEYLCNICGCEFTLKEVTSRTMEITAHGDKDITGVTEMNLKYLKSGSHYKIAIITDNSGRTSIIVTENPHVNNRRIIDVELPAKSGEFKDSFKPTVKTKREIEIEELKDSY